MHSTNISIAGIGAVTGYGWGIDTLWDGLSSGRPAAQQWYELGGRFPEGCWFARVPEGPERENSGTSRYAQAYAAAVDEALQDARNSGWEPGERVAIVHSTTRADLELMRTRYLAPESVSPRRSYVEQAWTTPPGMAMMRHQFTGPSMVVSAACSSGLHALAVAQRLLDCGDATDVVVTAADIGFDGEEMTLFASLGPLIHDAPPEAVCRPFQEGSRGFVLGEAAAAVVLSRSSTAHPYARLLSSTLGNDAYHPVAIKPDHVQMLRVVGDALAAAGTERSAVEYYSAHGTGTEECNQADTAVLDHLDQAAGYGLKPLLGHTMGAAPLMDTVVMAASYRAGRLPVPKPVSNGHPRLARDVIERDSGVTLQLGIGFGGNISAAVFDGSTAPGRAA